MRQREKISDSLQSRSLASSKFILPIVFTLAAGACISGCSSKKDPNTPRSIVEKPKTEEEVLLANATSTYDEGLFSIAEDNFTQLRDGFPASYFTPLAELKIADAKYFRGDFAGALAAYEEFVRLHPGSEAAPYLRYQIANCHIEQYRGRQYDQTPLHSAIRAYEQLLKEHPNSEYVVFARRNLDRSRQLLAKHEAYIAEFYEKQGATRAAEKRKEFLFTLYPDSAAAKQYSAAEQPAEASGELPEKIVDTLKPVAPNVLPTASVLSVDQRRMSRSAISPEQPLIAGVRADRTRDSGIQRERSPIAGDELSQFDATEAASALTNTQLFSGIECGTQGESSVFILYPKVRTNSADLSGNSFRVRFSAELATDPALGALEGSSPDELACRTNLLAISLKKAPLEISEGVPQTTFKFLGAQSVMNVKVLSLERPHRLAIYVSPPE